MSKGQQKIFDRKERIRFGAELGRVLRRHFDNPPYIPASHRIGFVWTPKLFSEAVGVSASAVRQWLRGDELPMLSMSAIIRVIFGPDPTRFSEEIRELWAVLRRCEDFRNGFTRPTQEIRPSKQTDSTAVSVLPTVKPLEVPVSSTIPRVAPFFMGRDDDVEALAGAVAASEGSSAILLRGEPGIGKTELAKAVAHHDQVVAHFGERRWLAMLDRCDDAQTLVSAICSTLGTDPDLGLAGISARLRSGPCLLILDNMEAPWERASSRAEIEGLLSNISCLPGLSLIITKRGSEVLQGVHWTCVHDVRTLEENDAAALFLNIANFKNPTDRFFRNFVQALGGLPLAIYLVALRAQGYSTLKNLWSEWKRIGAKLAEREKFDLTRHTSLSASIELSLNSPQLSEQAKWLFSIMGRLPDGLSGRERNLIAGDESFALEADLLGVGLCHERDGRLRLLPPIREYASRISINANDNLKWVRAILAPVSELQDSISSSYDDNLDRFISIADGLQNISAAIMSAPEITGADTISGCLDGLAMVARKYPLSVDVVTALERHFENDGGIEAGKASLVIAHIADQKSHLPLADISFRTAIEIFKAEEDEEALGRAYLQYGEYQNRRDRHRGRESLMQARDIARRRSDKFGEVNANTGLALASLADSFYKSARKTLENSIKYYVENKLWLRAAECSEALARIYEIQSLHETSKDNYDFAMSIWGSHGFKKDVARCAVRKAGLYFKMQQNELALVQSSEALEIYTELGDEQGVADCLYRLAMLDYYQGGSLSRSLSRLEQAEKIYEDAQNHNGRGHCTYFRALMTSMENAPEDYENRLLAARDFFWKAGNACERAQCTYELASFYFLKNRYDEFADSLNEATITFLENDDIIGVLNCKLLAANNFFGAGAYNDAEHLAVEVLDASRDCKSKTLEAHSLMLLADIFSTTQRHNEARLAYKQAAAIYKELGLYDQEESCLRRLGE